MSAAPTTLKEAEDTGAGTHRWTREEYGRAAEMGLLGPNQRLELRKTLRKSRRFPPNGFDKRMRLA